MASTPAQEQAFTEAVAAWHVANRTPSEESSTDLGVKVARVARLIGISAADAMADVRTSARSELTGVRVAPHEEAEIDAEASAKAAPERFAEQADRAASWARLVRAYRANLTEPTEATAAELGAASHAYGALAGLAPEAAVRKVRKAVWVKDHPARALYVSLMSGTGKFMGLPLTVNAPLGDMIDVMELQAELRKRDDVPSDAIIMGWSPFDQA